MSEPRWTPAYIGLGSNLEGPQRQVERAFGALAGLPESLLVARSRLYRSRPLGPQDQPDFVNAAAGLLTRLAPEDLLARLKQLEATLGREQPIRRWGPRVIDFDLLLYGAETRATPILKLPHPGLLERNWVLYPLQEIAPCLWVPGKGRVADLAAAIGTDGIDVLT
jgi:2-amino-4-hydroxy-6-hydroxymethyldihydropteridine diphosphokinase